MKRAVFNPLVARGFEMVFLPLRNFRLGEIRILNLPESLPANRPVLLVGNHVSNWDGFLFREIQRRLRPDWPIYSIMLEEEIRHYPIFRWLGGIGIHPTSPASIAGALRRVRELRQTHSDFFLSYFPQGKIFPSFKRPLDFKGGIDLFIRSMSPVTILPVGLHLEPMRKLAPTFFLSVGKPVNEEILKSTGSSLEDLVQGELDKLHEQLALHGESWNPSSAKTLTESIPA